MIPKGVYDRISCGDSKKLDKEAYYCKGVQRCLFGGSKPVMNLPVTSRINSTDVQNEAIENKRKEKSFDTIQKHTYTLAHQKDSVVHPCRQYDD